MDEDELPSKEQEQEQEQGPEQERVPKQELEQETVIDPETAFYQESDGSIRGGQPVELISESQVTVPSKDSESALLEDQGNTNDPGIASYENNDGWIEDVSVETSKSEPHSQDTLESQNEVVVARGEQQPIIDTGTALYQDSDGSIQGGRAIASGIPMQSRSRDTSPSQRGTVASSEHRGVNIDPDEALFQDMQASNQGNNEYQDTVPSRNNVETHCLRPEGVTYPCEGHELIEGDIGTTVAHVATRSQSLPVAHLTEPEDTIDPVPTSNVGDEVPIHSGGADDVESQGTLASRALTETNPEQAPSVIDPQTTFYADEDGSIHGGNAGVTYSQDTVESQSELEVPSRFVSGTIDPETTFYVDDDGSIHGGGIGELISQYTVPPRETVLSHSGTPAPIPISEGTVDEPYSGNDGGILGSTAQEESSEQENGVIEPSTAFYMDEEGEIHGGEVDEQVIDTRIAFFVDEEGDVHVGTST